MSNSSNPQSFAEDVSENKTKDQQKSKDESSAYPIEEGHLIDDPPPYEHASSDKVPAYLSAPSNQHSSVPHDVAERSARQRVCCCATRRGKCCCVIWFLVVLFLIIGIIAKTNNAACKNLNFESVDPTILYYDPNIFTTFSIDSTDSYIQDSEFWVYQNTSSTVTNAMVVTRIATQKNGNGYAKANSQNSVYQLSLHQAITSGVYFFGLFGMYGRCGRAHVELYLPQQLNYTTSLNVDNLNTAIWRNQFPYNQPINIKTVNGDILVDDLSVIDLSLSSEKSSIYGNLRSLSNQLSVTQANDGFIELSVQIAPNITSPKISVNAFQGYVGLYFNKSFAGTYNVLTDGNVVIRANRTRLPKYGTFNNGNGSLIVQSNHKSDVLIMF